MTVTGLRPGEKLFEELRYDKETVDRTQHEGIFVTRLEKIDMVRFDASLQELRVAAFAEDEQKTEDVIFETVPNEFRNAEAAAALLATKNLSVAEESRAK